MQFLFKDEAVSFKREIRRFTFSSYSCTVYIANTILLFEIVMAYKAATNTELFLGEITNLGSCESLITLCQMINT